MKEEIFGPILPVIEYDDFDQVMAKVKAQEKPLAIYYLGNTRTHFDRLLNETSSGAVTWNEVMFQAGETATGFGGVGNSGMGRIAGYDAFK